MAKNIKNDIKISIIIVTWNSQDYIEDCLNSIYKNSFKDFEIIVIDNFSADLTVHLLREKYPDIKLIQSDNIGFGAACNLGFHYSKGKYVFFLNPDTEVKLDCLKNIYDFLENNDAHIVGAKLLWPDGRYQDSYKRFFGPFASWLELFEVHYYFPNNYVNREINYDFEIFDKPAEVDWVIGAAFAVRREIFTLVNGFDEDFFMYFEEIDLCRRVRKLGGKIYFLPSCEVIHKKGKSSVMSNVRSVEYFKSLYLYHLKHSSLISAFFIRISIALMCFIYLFVLFIKFVFFKQKAAIKKKIKDKIILFRWSIGL